MLTHTQQQLLIKTRELMMDDYSNKYICPTLKYAAEELGYDQSEIDGLVLYIDKQLDPYSFLELWQKNNGFGDRSNVRRRKDRINWISWMLREI